jgi:hypothetical protein
MLVMDANQGGLQRELVNQTAFGEQKSVLGLASIGFILQRFEKQL